MRIRQVWTLGNDRQEHVREFDDETTFNLAAPPADPDANAALLAESIRRTSTTDPAAMVANESSLDSKLDQALGANDAFLAIVSPSPAQQLAQLRLVTRECSALIRKLRRKLDSTAGT